MAGATDSPQTVKRFLEQIKSLVEPRFAQAFLIGEVSNFRSSGRHWYFTLKEEGASLSCAVWMSQQRQLKHVPKDGDSVLVWGGLNVFVAGGGLTLTVTQCRQAGLGDIQLKLRDIAAALRSEGVFDGPKRRLPPFPKKLAVVAAPGGAALRDILEVTAKRAPGIDVMVFPAVAQGESCATENIMALLEAQDVFWGCDAVIMARGGGSAEDLWGYNDPDLARAVSRCRLPIVTGVGHEIDVSMVDLAADVRAATPSQAAELATPELRALRGDVASKGLRLSRQMDWKLRGFETTLNLALERGLLHLDPFGRHRERFARMASRLEVCSPSAKLCGDSQRLERMKLRLSFAGRSLADGVGPRGGARIAGLEGRLHAAVGQMLRKAELRETLAHSRLSGLDPERPLEVGFALISDSLGRRVLSAADTDLGARLRLKWKDGERWARVE